MLEHLTNGIQQVLESLQYPAVSVDDVNRVVGMPKAVSVKKNGRLVQEIVFEETPIEKMNEGLTVDDFALENLLANGYQPHRIDSSVESLDTIDSVVENTAKAASAVKKVKQSKTE